MDITTARNALETSIAKFRETAAAYEAGVINWETFGDELPELAAELATHAEDLIDTIGAELWRRHAGGSR